MKTRTKHILAALLSVLLLLAAFSPMVAAKEDSLNNLYTAAVKNGNVRGLLMADGTADSSYYVFTSGSIAVEEGDVITFGPIQQWLPHYLQAYDENGVLADANVSIDRLTLPERNLYNYHICSYTVPAGVASVRLALPADMGIIFTITKNQPFDAVDFNAYWQDPSRVKYVQKLGQLFEEKTDSPLRGHSALFLGDSICYAADNDFYYNAGWAGRLDAINGMDTLNLSSPGASLSTVWADNRIVAQFDQTTRTDFEFIVMQGVANDASQDTPIGTLSEGFDAELDESTVAGGIEGLFREAKRRYPNATLGFIITYPLPLLSSGAYPDIDEYVDLLIAACEKWEIPYLDLYHDKEFYNDVLKVNSNVYLFDGVHPNGAGYDLIYPEVEAFMEELLEIRYPSVEKPSLDAEPVESTAPALTDETATTDAPSDNEPSDDAPSGCASSLSLMPCLALPLIGAVLVGHRSKKRPQ